MTEFPGIGPLNRPRRGVALGTFVIWILVAAAGGAIAWELYGNDVRSKFGMKAPTTPANPSYVTNSNEIIGLVKDLQTSDQRMADDVRTALQLLTAEQAAVKALSDALAALQGKVDALQRPAVLPVKKPAPLTVRKSPPPALRPSADRPEQIEPEQEPAAATVPSPR